jgi:iron complex outermembrane receptor protein
MDNRRITATPLLAGSLLLAAPAFADVVSDSSSLETVIVTASKREEQLKDVPMSVTALNGADLQRGQETQFTDFAAQVPGLSLQAINPAETRLVLRGMNVGSSGATVATVVDDMPFSMSGAQANGAFFGADVDTFDLNRVEILPSSRPPGSSAAPRSTMARPRASSRGWSTCRSGTTRRLCA